MGKKDEQPEQEPAETPDPEGPAANSTADVIAPPDEPDADVDELEELRDRYLRLAAEFDNFRKRRAREQIENRERSQGELLSGLLDPLDDLARVSDVDPSHSVAAEVIQGVELVERKLLRQLEIAGLERVGAVDEAFDPNLHEAVMSVPADGPDQDHTVGAVLQVGYRFHKQLLRPARVQVRIWDSAGAESAQD